MGRSRLLVCMLPLLASTGCRFGRVEQGRVVAYDGEKGVVTLVRDSNYREPGKPRFDVLPAETVRIPEDRNEMGPVPEAGKLLAIDRDARRLITFDSGGLRSYPYTPVEEHANVRSDDPRVAGKVFPLVDTQKKVITTYDPAARVLLAFAAADDQLRLPPEIWRAGDEVRYYYKQPGQALRLMNVTRTDIRKSGH